MGRAMTEHGILFSAPMVRAILAGTKTQTRRAVKPQPPDDDPVIAVERYAPTVVDRRGEERPGPEVFGAYGNEWGRRCPHPPGTRLYVRETTGRTADGRLAYRADGDSLSVPKWTPSLLMPKSRARIFLDVTEVRVERVQDISDADIVAEGVDVAAVRALWEAATRKERRGAGTHDTDCWFACNRHGAQCESLLLATPRDLWRIGWTLINGVASWRSNPYVWAYTFKPADGKAGSR